MFEAVHALAWMCAGSLETLGRAPRAKGLDIREAVVAFHQRCLIQRHFWFSFLVALLFAFPWKCALDFWSCEMLASLSWGSVSRGGMLHDWLLQCV
eukprot:1162129-Pelagomonas_calceolata.AAC.2